MIKIRSITETIHVSCPFTKKWLQLENQANFQFKIICRRCHFVYQLIILVSNHCGALTVPHSLANSLWNAEVLSYFVNVLVFVVLSYFDFCSELLVLIFTILWISFVLLKLKHWPVAVCQKFNSITTLLKKNDISLKSSFLKGIFSHSWNLFCWS